MAVTTKSKKKVPEQAVELATPFVLQMLDIADVIESPRNTKLHTPAQVKDIALSIKHHGFRDPIAVDGNMEIVEGHGRIKALKLMGVTKVPALVFKDMTPDQIRSYRITHNKLTLDTGFDIAALTTELRDLQTSGSDLEVTGFSVSDLESFELQMETSSVKAEKGQASEETSEKQAKETEADNPASTKDTATVTNYQYVMIFDDKAQQQRWTAFLKHLKAEVPGETIAERVNTYLEGQGF